MATDWNEAFRTYSQRSTRVFTVVREQPSWVTRVAFGAALLVMLSIVFLLVVPAVVLFLVVFAAGSLIHGIKRRVSGLWRPNGALDGRKNVRVIAPRDRS